MDLSNPAILLIAGIYYIAAGFLVFFSLFGVYVLIRYGESKLLGLFISVIYGVFFLTILANSYQILQGI